MLDSTPYSFALELAVAASRREYLDLQQWLSDRFRQLALPFFQVGCRTKRWLGKAGRNAKTGVAVATGFPDRNTARMSPGRDASVHGI